MYARNAFIKQSQEVEKILKEPLYVHAVVENTSDRPVHDAEFCWAGGQPWEPNPEPLGMIMPGTKIEKARLLPTGTDMAVGAAVLRFRDAANVIWIRQRGGGLAEQE